MVEKMRYILRVLIIALFNVCIIGIIGYALSSRESVPAVAKVSGKPYTVTAESDYLLLARLIASECPDGPYTGKVAVGAVVLNRVHHPSFPDTIAGVAYQAGEFASVSSGRIDAEAGASELRAAKEALNGFDPSGGAIYYYDRKEKANDRLMSRPIVKIIGNRVFCG